MNRRINSGRSFGTIVLLNAALLIRIVGVQRSGDSDTRSSVRQRHYLICVTLLTNRGTRLIEVFQNEMPYPYARNLDARDNVASANTMDPARTVKFLTLAEKIAGLLWLGD